MIVSALAFGRLSVRTAAFSGPLCLLADDVRHTECTPNERPHRVESDRSSQIPLPCGSSSRPSSLGDDSRLRVLHPPAAQHNPYTSFDLVIWRSSVLNLDLQRTVAANIERHQLLAERIEEVECACIHVVIQEGDVNSLFESECLFMPLVYEANHLYNQLIFSLGAKERTSKA
ncbi:hypothetical protein OPV22_002438 [Ensete ventricosum]|uniref:Uncharacterized protein n=1 Tax=Ensete ventricosum TaxID=4639 RepID=A0AAV8RY12_ENSVE|nr:hypothetical protein OPV22_002438 [Ensete ventricosum]